MLGLLRIGRRLTRARSGAYHHETLHECRMPERECLGNVAADRKSEDIYVRKAEGTNEVGGVVPHRINGVGRLAARTGDTGIVEKDHRTVHGEAVGDCGIPMVHPAAEVLHEKQRLASVSSEAPVREADSVRFDELRWRSHVRVRHPQSPSPSRTSAI